VEKDSVDLGRWREETGPQLRGESRRQGSLRNPKQLNIKRDFSRSLPFGSKRIIITVSIPKKYGPLLEAGEKIRRVEGWKKSRLRLEGLAMLVNEKREEIYPQVQLDGSHVTFTDIW